MPGCMKPGGGPGVPTPGRIGEAVGGIMPGCNGGIVGEGETTPLGLGATGFNPFLEGTASAFVVACCEARAV